MNQVLCPKCSEDSEHYGIAGGFAEMLPAYKCKVCGLVFYIDINETWTDMRIGLPDLKAQLRLCDRIQSHLAHGGPEAQETANLLEGLANFLSELHAALKKDDNVVCRRQR